MHFRRLYLTLLTLLLTASPLAAQTQPTQKSANPWSEWETLTPDGEEFTVSMPKNPTTETTKFPYHQMELNTRLYLATSTAGPVLAITSISGIKSNLGTEFARFNSYMDAFKSFFPAKIRPNNTPVPKLVLVSSRPFHGHTGRSYNLTIGDLNGVVHSFVTRKRFYAVVSLNTKKDEALEEKFLSSFVLPERQPDPPKTAAAGAQGNTENEQTIDGQQPSAEQKQANAQNETPVTEQPANADAGNNKEQPNQTPNQTQNQQGQKKGPIAGGMLNSKAIYLPMPEVPAGEAAGVVLVQVIVDEQGSVAEARAISGPQHLHAAAVNAARLARFSPTLMMGEAVRVSGTLSYNFTKAN
jgi:TonB-like protein